MDAFDRAVEKELVTGWQTGWRIHLFVYAAVNTMLALIWWFTSDGGTVLPWFIFPVIGWGIGLAAHYMAYRSKRSTLPTG
jgi:hypothetical protein